MAPPEVWGPPVWNFIHTLAEKVNEDSFNVVKTTLFLIIKRICIYLPCPECSQHAKFFLMKVNIAKINSKSEFKHMLFVFHNVVNNRKRKPLFNYNILNKYKFMTIPETYNKFINVYNTKGNLNLIMESFQRSLVIKELQFWLQRNHKYFKPKQIQQPVCTSNNNITNDTNIPENNEMITNENSINEEEHDDVIDEVIVPVVVSNLFKVDDYQNEEPVIEEPVIEEPVVEEPVIEEPVIEEPVVEEPVIEEPVVEEPVIEEPVVEEPVIEEPVVEEPVIEEPVIEEPVVEEPVVEEPVVEEIRTITENDFEPITEEEINEQQTLIEFNSSEIIELALQMIKSKQIES
jgi:hypothetical protein